MKNINLKNIMIVKNFLLFIIFAKIIKSFFFKATHPAVGL